MDAEEVRVDVKGPKGDDRSLIGHAGRPRVASRRANNEARGPAKDLPGVRGEVVRARVGGNEGRADALCGPVLMNMEGAERKRTPCHRSYVRPPSTHLHQSASTFVNVFSGSSISLMTRWMQEAVFR